MADQITLRKETNLYDDLAIKTVNDKVTSQYAVCTTPSNTVAKTATVDGNFELFKNARVSVFFQNANTTTAPTLNIANTGAKPIWAYGGTLSADGNTFNWVANSTIEFVYDGSHWCVADSGAVGLISKYDEKMNQEAIFNKLTNDGAIRGIFMQNGQLYVNMDYLQTGTLKLGGANNGNGIMTVYNASGTEIGRWDNTGLSATGNLAIVNDYASLNADNSYAFYPSGADVAYGKRNALQTYIQQPISGVNRKTKHAWLCDGESHVYNAANGYSRVVRCGQDPDATTPTTTIGSIYKEIISSDGLQLYYKDYYNNWETQARFSSTVIHLGYMVSSPVFLGVANAYSSGSYIGQFHVRAGVAQTVNVSIEASTTASASLTISPTVAQINGKNIQFQSSSSKRYKHNITSDISSELDAKRLYDLRMIQFVYNEGHDLQYADMDGQTIPGFIAEDVAEIYPAAVIHDANGNIESWDERRIIPGMLALIQEQKKQLDEQAEQIKYLEWKTSFIHLS